MTAYTAEQISAAVDRADIVELLQALGQSVLHDGGPCPDCGERAWAPDQLTWLCSNGHRGLIHRLRRAVLDNLPALRYLLDGDVTGHRWPTTTKAPSLDDLDDHLFPRAAVLAHLAATTPDLDWTAFARIYVAADGPAAFIAAVDAIQDAPEELRAVADQVRGAAAA